MPRFKLTIEYDGAPFVGWQAQSNGPSVQARIGAAVAALTGELILPRGAGRTDGGVHALGQAAHLDLGRDWAPGRLRDALNAHLRPDPVSILSCERVDDTFDARFSAVTRHYLYRILDRRSPLALDRGRVWRVAVPLDAGVMHEAAQALVGNHDFTTFRAAECQAKSPVKTLDRLDVAREGHEIVLFASARSFLHNQVRSMVGSLMEVGRGAWTASDLAAALHARDRARCGPVAPPDGLYLVRVDY